MFQSTLNSPAQPVLPTSPVSVTTSELHSTAQNPGPKKKLFSGKSRAVLAIVALVFLAGLSSLGILIADRQAKLGTRPVTPNAPESQPQASVLKPRPCTLTFVVPPPSSTPSPTPTTGPRTCDSACNTNADCTAINPNWSCLYVQDPDGPNTQVQRCRLTTNPASLTCTPGNTPTPTPSPTITLTPSPTPTGVLSPTPTLEISVTPSVTPPNNPTPTNPPGVTVNPTTPGTTTTYTVVTTVNCNDTCSRNSDCSNPSHICSGGRCRLDANPDDVYCRMPAGQTTVIVNAIPTRAPLPQQLPQSGPADWGNFLLAGFGALGVGSLMLLLF